MSFSATEVDGLEFNEAEHVYRYQGRVWPSVTQCLDAYGAYKGVDPVLLKRAAEFGTHVHLACHLFNEERLDWDTLDPALVGHVRGWERFLEETGAVVLSSECRVVSRRHGFCGTLDSRVAWGRTIRLVDIKSTTVMPPTTGPQTAAYVEAWHEMTGERMRDRYCVQLTGHGRYKLERLTDPRDWQTFKSYLVVRDYELRTKGAAEAFAACIGPPR